jgi:hypothetical protein
MNFSCESKELYTFLWLKICARLHQEDKKLMVCDSNARTRILSEHAILLRNERRLALYYLARREQHGGRLNIIVMHFPKIEAPLLTLRRCKLILHNEGQRNKIK